MQGWKGSPCKICGSTVFRNAEGIWQISKQMLKCKKVLAEIPLRMEVFAPLLVKLPRVMLLCEYIYMSGYMWTFGNFPLHNCVFSMMMMISFACLVWIQSSKYQEMRAKFQISSLNPLKNPNNRKNHNRCNGCKYFFLNVSIKQKLTFKKKGLKTCCMWSSYQSCND